MYHGIPGQGEWGNGGLRGNFGGVHGTVVVSPSIKLNNEQIELKKKPTLIYKRIVSAMTPYVDGKPYISYTNFPKKNTYALSRTKIDGDPDIEALKAMVPEFGNGGVLGELKFNPKDDENNALRTTFIDKFDRLHAAIKEKGYDRLYNALNTGMTSGSKSIMIGGRKRSVRKRSVRKIRSKKGRKSRSRRSQK